MLSCYENFRNPKVDALVKESLLFLHRQRSCAGE